MTDKTYISPTYTMLDTGDVLPEGIEPGKHVWIDKRLVECCWERICNCYWPYSLIRTDYDAHAKCFEFFIQDSE